MNCTESLSCGIWQAQASPRLRLTGFLHNSEKKGIFTMTRVRIIKLDFTLLTGHISIMDLKTYLLQQLRKPAWPFVQVCKQLWRTFLPPKSLTSLSPGTTTRFLPKHFDVSPSPPFSADRWTSWTPSWSQSLLALSYFALGSTMLNSGKVVQWNQGTYEVESAYALVLVRNHSSPHRTCSGRRT